MTSTQDSLTARHDDTQPLLWNLARISGTLSEIATAWRRAQPGRPELPLILPEQLRDAARQLAADIRALAGADPVQPPELALSVADQFSSLQENITSAQAITRGPGMPEVGDGKLWESLRAPLHQAGTQLTSPMPQLATPQTDWPRPGTARAGTGHSESRTATRPPGHEHLPREGLAGVTDPP
jgi:hypothetical protein